MFNISDEIVDDETSDHNLRYIGKNPNNYVSFNGELWRIIGVMNDVADENGTIESRVKLIRNTYIGSYSFDNKAAGTGSSTSDYGSNDWSDSAIQEVLNNGAYYNRTTGYCPSGAKGATTACDFSSTGLTSEAKSMISKVKWKLGGSFNILNASDFYMSERGTDVYSGRPIEWIGEVGLMYPSDYGYATSGGSTTDRSTCLNENLLRWEKYVTDCKGNDWLLYSSSWTITPIAPSTDNDRDWSYYMQTVTMSGGINGANTNVSERIYPVVYLSTSTKIQSGTGTSTDPFILAG